MVGKAGKSRHSKKNKAKNYGGAVYAPNAYHGSSDSDSDSDFNPYADQVSRESVNKGPSRYNISASSVRLGNTMKLFMILTTLVAFASSSPAGAVSRGDDVRFKVTRNIIRRQAQTPPSSVAGNAAAVAPTGPRYRLRTNVRDYAQAGGNATRFNGLYPITYHTGAGLNDAVLTPYCVSGVEGYIDANQWVFDLGTPFPWALALGPPQPYQSWNNVMINAGQGSPDFDLDYVKGLTGRANAGWYGWLVCDWAHMVPQLFYYSYPNVTSGSVACADVDLVPELVLDMPSANATSAGAAGTVPSGVAGATGGPAV